MKRGRAGHYRSLEHFYRADGRRQASEERDMGLWWRESSDEPLHRAAWVRDTGELYLVRLGPGPEGGTVELLGFALDEPELERALVGWQERCGRERSLSWLRSRAAHLRPALIARPRRVVAFAATP
ncbi:MAG TPA: hypothetical protein VHX88_03555 [Solirubrobacteraceae bacterium]|nr:hypothetical protein [Solirubrobacteraceae bacterium]